MSGFDLNKRTVLYSFVSSFFAGTSKNKINICVSTVAFSNIYYLVRQEFNEATRQTLTNFKELVRIVDSAIIEQALQSDFKDFEDGIQYFTAVENHVKVILTRNLRDYKTAKIPVMTPETY